MASIAAKTGGYAATGQSLDVLLISTAANIGGMERVVCGLARELEHRGRRVCTVFPETASSAGLLAWCREQDVPATTDRRVLDAAAPHRWRDIWALRRMVRSFRPAVVNLHYGDNFISLKDVIAVRFARPGRCVVSVHHPTPWERTPVRKRLLTRLASWLVDDVTTFSRATAGILREAGVRDGRLRIIPCGVMPPARSPVRAAARARFGIPESAFVVGFLGRHVAYKRLDLLVDAVSQIPEQDVVLLVAGDGPERTVWENLAVGKLGARAQFVGPLAQTDDFYAACDVFALPSELEGFGLVYIEAAFHGVPSVGSRVGGVPDAILDGQTGILVPPGDVDALRSAIGRLLRDEGLRRRMGGAARERAYADLTEATMADRFEHVFRLDRGEA